MPEIVTVTATPTAPGSIDEPVEMAVAVTVPPTFFILYCPKKVNVFAPEPPQMLYASPYTTPVAVIHVCKVVIVALVVCMFAEVRVDVPPVMPVGF